MPAWHALRCRKAFLADFTAPCGSLLLLAVQSARICERKAETLLLGNTRYPSDILQISTSVGQTAQDSSRANSGMRDYREGGSKTSPSTFCDRRATWIGSRAPGFASYYRNSSCHFCSLVSLQHSCCFKFSVGSLASQAAEYLVITNR